MPTPKTATDIFTVVKTRISLTCVIYVPCRWGIKVLRTEVEECACLKCGQPASTCSIEILGLFFFAGVYLIIVIVVLLALAFSTRNDTPAAGQLRTGNATLWHG
jgi:hypothetical protein